MGKERTRTISGGDDGSALLSSRAVEGLLSAAVDHAGGQLVDWVLDHIDTHPQHSTTATYSAVVEWPFGRREELLGVSARAHGLAASDERAEIFADGDREVAVWLYPKDPDLPGLARAAYPDSMAEMLRQGGLIGPNLTGADLDLEMIGYRPRRRAVLRVRSMTEGAVFYVKVFRESTFKGIVHRHRLLAAASVPAPEVALATRDHLLVLHELPGRPLAQAVFDAEPPCTAEQLVEVLDTMPAAVADLPRRPPWSDAIAHYGSMVAQALPEVEPKVEWLVEQIRSGLTGIPPGNEPTHGDFHEGQVHVMNGRVCGILDIDTVGPGRRADDLACLIAHMSTIQRMGPEHAVRVHALLQEWVPVFDERVDPIELRLRAAAVITSLATGPYRGQEPDWRRETSRMIESAEALVHQVL